MKFPWRSVCISSVLLCVKGKSPTLPEWNAFAPLSYSNLSEENTDFLLLAAYYCRQGLRFILLHFAVMNTIGYFEIQSTAPQRELSFYEAIFGWKFIRETFTPLEYYRIETNSIYGGLLKRPVAVPPPGGTNAYVCSVQVSSFDDTAGLILNNGGRVAFPKFAVPGRCWQGYFLDQDGNTFGIFETDEQAK